MIGLRPLSRFKTTYSKKDLGVLFKKMNIDSKHMFGELLETNKTRKKRLSLVDENRDKVKRKKNGHLDRPKSKIKAKANGKILFCRLWQNWRVLKKIFILRLKHYTFTYPFRLPKMYKKKKNLRC